MRPGVFRCPVCQGRIALWVMRPTCFTCHHCRWVLKSNLGVARLQALLVAAVVDVLLLLGVWLWLGDISRALSLWAVMAAAVGVGAWHLAVHRFAKLVPVRAQRPDGG